MKIITCRRGETAEYFTSELAKYGSEYYAYHSGGTYKWYLKQNSQDEKIIELEEHHNEDIRQLKKEFRLVCEALSACLDGLIQQGCNHTVPKAKQKLDEYLNQQAHE